MSVRGFIRALTLGLALCGALAAGAQTGAESWGHLSVDSKLGSDFALSQLRSDSFLNPDNALGQNVRSGLLWEDLNLQADYACGLNLRLESIVRWFNWNQDLPAAAIGTSLAGGNPRLDINSWDLSWTSLDGLFSLGLSKQVWEPGPGRQLKAANLLGWLFGPVPKTMAWLGLTLDYGSLKFLWAPRGDWLGELHYDQNRQYGNSDLTVLPGGDLFMLQGQLFLSGFDAGAYLAYDNDWNAGLWFSLPLDKNLILYGEGSYTSKNWVANLNGANFSVDFLRGNGFRAMLGLLYSPDWVDLSAYLESAYNGDALSEADWQDLGHSLATLDSLRHSNPAMFSGSWMGGHGNLAIAWRYQTMAPWNLALHLKPNSLLGKVMDWNISLNYAYPSLLYCRAFIGLSLGKGFSLQATWDLPLALFKPWSANPATAFMYAQTLTISASLLAQTKLDFN